MTLVRDLIARVRRSRMAAVASAAVVGLLLTVAAPSFLAALGSFSAPVGCHSAPDDFSDDFSDDFTDDFSEGVVGDHSEPCVLVPDSSGEGDGDGGGDAEDLDDVIGGTPTFTG